MNSLSLKRLRQGATMALLVTAAIAFGLWTGCSPSSSPETTGEQTSQTEGSSPEKMAEVNGQTSGKSEAADSDPTIGEPAPEGQDTSEQAASASSESENQEADQAWEAVVEASQPPSFPPEWRDPKNRPSEEDLAQFRQEQGEQAGKAALLAREFYTEYPEHAKAEDAKSTEFEMLTAAAQLGNTNHVDRLNEIKQAKLRDPNLSDDERFEIRLQEVRQKALEKQSQGSDVMLTSFADGARQLAKEFPNRDEPYRLLLSVASNLSGNEAQKTLKEVAQSEQAPQELKQRAESMLEKYEALGQPLELSFTALDGREVDLQKMKGKVVLIDFWATWCGPCIQELPNVKKAYENLHPKGFEIIGISFDQSKTKLEDFLKENEMPWPQYFDGKGWQNELGQRFGINAIPAMWLVDKEGKLVDMNARADLETKVEKLLAEN